MIFVFYQLFSVSINHFSFCLHIQYITNCFPGLLLSISMYTFLFFLIFFFFLYGNDENWFDLCKDVLGTQSVLPF